MSLNCKVLLFFLVSTISVQSQNNPWIQDMRSGFWGTNGVQISEISFDSKISGLFSRTAMTLSFRDVLSSQGSDSMQVSFNFNLPENTVVDSMYLWINGKPQPAALKERWSAVQTYNQIVGRRCDPALLQKTYGNSYSLQIFPFSHRQERKIRICYTTALSTNGNDLLFAEYPLGIASGTITPVEKISVKVLLEGVSETNYSIKYSDAIVPKILSTGSGPTIEASAVNITPKEPLFVNIKNQFYLEKGMAVSFTKKDSGDISFIALLEPGKLITAAKKTRSKNILILLNMVSVTQYYYNPNTDQLKSYNFSEYSNTQIKTALLSFVRNYLQPGDKFNIAVNDGDIKYLYNKPNTTTSVSDDVAHFFDKQISHSNKTNCTDPVDFFVQSLTSVPKNEQLDLILIDQQYSYQYPLDTIGIETSKKKLLAQLPENCSVFGLIGYNWSNPVARVQNAIIEAKRGLAFYSWGDLNSIFSTIGKTLTPYIQPASVSISSNMQSFTHDVLNPKEEHMYIGMPLLYMGRIHGAADSIHICFNGVFDGKDYSAYESFAITTQPDSIDLLGKLWASRKVDNLTYQQQPAYALNTFSEATNISLQYRILTGQTALLALEPGLFSDDKYIDDNTNTNENVVSVKVTNALTSTLSMTAAAQRNIVTIKISGFDMKQNSKEYSLKIYDLQGKLIADLSSSLKVNAQHFTIEWKNNAAASRVYLVRLKFGKNIIEKRVTIYR